MAECSFAFTYNKTVTPSVLDGGDQLVLANVQLTHRPTCDPRRLPSLPTSSYALADRSILCNCTLQADLAYLPADVAACKERMPPIHFQEQRNLAFETLFSKILPNETFSPPTYPSVPYPRSKRGAPLPPTILPVNLTLPNNLSTKLATLRDLQAAFADNLSFSRTPGREALYKTEENFGYIEDIRGYLGISAY